jgi:hypothetical protein
VRVEDCGDAAGGGMVGRAAAGGLWRMALLLLILRTCSKWVAAIIAVAVEPRGDR